MHPLSYYRIEVVNCFSRLDTALRALPELLLKDAQKPQWMQPLPYPTLSDPNPHQASINLIQQLQYQEGQEGREILLGVGLFAVSQDTFTQLERINQCKSEFKRAILQLKIHGIKTTDEWLALEFEALLNKSRHEATQATLSRSGLSRLHLKQCYRQIPLLHERPMKVSWSWANTRSIKKISKADALTLLQKKGNDEGIRQQMQLVEGLPPNEQLAIIQELPPHLRTNIVTPTVDGVKRFMLKGSLPLFYVDDGQPFPECVPPKVSKQGVRNKRSDFKIDPSPFLPAIRGHRYIV